MLQNLIAELKQEKYFRLRLAYLKTFKSKPPEFCQIPNLPPALAKYLNAKHITPYSHQCQTMQLAREGYHVIITTPTASGKTLAYNLPVLEQLELNPQATALYIFPTKALSNDQLKNLKQYQQITGLKLAPAIYDGDTPQTQKSLIRNFSKIILTNPYELHRILPWNYQWVRFLSNLKFVVIDEAHHYRGIYGSNIAFLIRRLRRLLMRWNVKPQFILSSATLANPLEFANNLTGLYFKLVDSDGAPKGTKYFILYNPYFQIDNKVINQISVTEETSRLLVKFLQHQVRTLVFTRSRRMTELITQRTRELLRAKKIPLSDKVAAYRAGYLPAERRKIENQLKTGELLAVVATNALELGIDIGMLQAVIITGFPGTIISTHQQAGRAGRRNEQSLALMVAYHDKLDQYFMKHPHEFFARPFEHAIINLKNPYIAAGHILCAAAESPIQDTDFQIFDKNTLTNAIKAFEKRKLIQKTKQGWIFTGKVVPTELVSLNGTQADTFKIIYNGKILETIDKYHAFREAFPNAVFLHQGETFIVTEFNLEQKIISVVQKNVDYYTVPLKISSASILQTLKTKHLNNATLHLGRLNVTEEFTGYKIKRADKVIGYGDLDLPKLEFETTGLWITFPKEIEQQIWEKHKSKKPSIPSLTYASPLYDPKIDILAGGLHGAEHALIGIMPFHVMADRWDIGGFSTIQHPDTGLPSIFIYDGYPGGIGLTEKAFDIFNVIAQMAAQVVDECSCQDGCPACIMSPKCGNENRPLDKQASSFILNLLLS